MMKAHIKDGEKTIEIETEDKNILIALAESSIFINAYCGGRGVCRKCKIRYVNNAPEPNHTEKQVFTSEDIKKGFRLACMHELKGNDFIEIFKSQPAFVNLEKDICIDNDGTYIAFDIGTTTISSALIKDNQLECSDSVLNPQVSLGSDILSRIAYSNENSIKIPADILNKSIQNILDDFTKRCSLSEIDQIIVSANPTMISFFLGMDPKPIGEYPYTPPFTGSLRAKWNSIDVYIPPVISAFIGSDITAGLINADLNDDFLFIDIGTNCEFVLKFRDNIYAASVPGGPALEGSGIDYGMMADNGAIETVSFDKTIKCSTIGSVKAAGIAGSGLISAVALLRQYGLIDKNGRLISAWESENIPLQLLNRIKNEGFLLENSVYLTQRSIREFQLVKAALNAGIEILMKKTKADIENMNEIYISGGFTQALSSNDIVSSDLLNIDRNFTFMGNSSINGAMKLFCKKNVEKIEKIASSVQYIEVANESNFQELYIKYMDFA